MGQRPITPKAGAGKIVANKPAEAKAPDAKPSPPKPAAAARHGNPVGRMQAAVAAAVSDPEWQQF